MIIDSERTEHSLTVVIKRAEVERVSTYKYFEVVFDRSLNWKENTESRALFLPPASWHLTDKDKLL